MRRRGTFVTLTGRSQNNIILAGTSESNQVGTWSRIGLQCS